MFINSESELNHSWESDGRDSNYQVQRLINLGLIKDLILPLLSMDLQNGERAEKKGEAAGIRSLIRPSWLVSGLGNWSPDHQTPSCDFAQIHC